MGRRPRTFHALLDWINAEFGKNLSIGAGRRLVGVLETEEVLHVMADDRVVYQFA